MNNLFKIITILLVSNLTIASKSKCLIDKYDKYYKLKKSWLSETMTILINAMPKQEDLIKLMTKEQLARHERRRLAIEVLVSGNYGKEWIDTSLPVPVWTSIGKDKRLVLSKNNKMYSKLNEESQKLTSEYNSRDKSPLKELYAVKVRNNKEWLNSISVFNSQVEMINSISCE